VRKTTKVLRWALSTVAIALVCTALAELLVYTSGLMLRPPLQGLENQLVDVAFQVRLNNPVHQSVPVDQIVIVDIDDASIQRLGRTQLWPRAYDAHAISYIASGNPRAIGIDFLYTEPDTLSDVYAELLRGEGFSNPEGILEAMRTDDSLAHAIANAGNVYLSFFDEDEGVTRSDSLLQNTGLRLIPGDEGSARAIPNINRPVFPVADFANGARAVGAISMPSMQDGSVRHYQLVQQVSSQSGQLSYVGNFPLYMLLDEFGLNERDVAVSSTGLRLAEGVEVPLSDRGSFRINWLGSEENIRYISFYKVIQEMIPAEFFEGKYVFFGTSASGLQDLKTVPCRAEKMPGVEVHAVAFLNMINGAFIREVSTREARPYFFLLAMVFVGIFLIIRPILSFIISIALVFAQLSSFILIVLPKYSVSMPFVTLMLITLLCYIFSSLYIYFIRERKSRRLKSAFASYVPRDVVDKIARDSSAVKLGGEKKVLTVLFSDIRGFTAYSEKLDPQDLVAVLNNYLSEMSEVIFKYKGTIDKFIGDAIMAMFGAPIHQPDHADLACNVALDMIITLQRLNKEQAQKGLPPLRIGIGLNTGEMTVGNIGSLKRFDYTVIGDSVNLGSRIESLTKLFGVDVMVSNMTRQACKSKEFVFRELAEVIVKGKDEPVVVYQLVGRRTDAVTHDFALSIWEMAFESFRANHCEKALALFTQYLELHPTDMAANHYSVLCKEFMEFPDRFSLILKMESK